MLRKLAILMAVAAAFAFASATVYADPPDDQKPPWAGKPAFEVGVAPGESKSIQVQGENGRETVTITNVSEPAADGEFTIQSVYRQTCWISWEGRPLGFVSYKMILYASWYYDWYSVWGQTSALSTSSVHPYYWSDRSHYNQLISIWEAYAQGSAVLNYRPTAWPTVWSKTYHLWISQHSDGSCWGSGWVN